MIEESATETTTVAAAGAAAAAEAIASDNQPKRDQLAMSNVVSVARRNAVQQQLVARALIKNTAKNTTIAYESKQVEFIEYCEKIYLGMAPATVTEPKLFDFLFYQAFRPQRKRGGKKRRYDGGDDDDDVGESGSTTNDNDSGATF